MQKRKNSLFAKLLNGLRPGKFQDVVWEYKTRAVFRFARSSRHKTVNPAECIIFSKDRALQLHGLLRSFFENVIPKVPVRVLYATSSPDHEKAYADVKEIFSGEGIIFLRQQSAESFRSDLLKELDAIQSDRIFFLVDDIVFIDKVDLGHFCSCDPARYIPTLRMGLNLKLCYTMQQDQPLPHYTENNDAIYWRWQDGVLDWGYPLSVDGHIFSTGEMAAMLKMIDFRAPNSLEGNLQRFQKMFLPRLGIAYRTSKIVNIPCNKVQLENDNIHGREHQDVLLGYWQQGLQLDVGSLFGFVNESAHQNVALQFVARKNADVIKANNLKH